MEKIYSSLLLWHELSLYVDDTNLEQLFLLVLGVN